MCPRLTFSETSRTAKNPANSLVNPWVSRMNSSAKYFPPAAPGRFEPCAARFLAHGPVSHKRSENLPQPPSGAGICRHPGELGKAESSKAAGLGADPAWSFVAAGKLPSRPPADGPRPYCLPPRRVFIENFPLAAKICPFRGLWIFNLQFESANASVVRSIKQRVLLNAWIRALRAPGSLPAIAEFTPDGLADELPDMMAFDVEGTGDDARFFITHEGSRLAAAYGNEHIDPAARINRYLDRSIEPIVY